MLKILIIGAGPAGLMAADYLSSLSYQVTVADRMPSPARKFLMAGRGGLNLTHSEPFQTFLTRYREASGVLTPLLEVFTPGDLRSWCKDLGQDTFVGSSGRVFPVAMKASPLLRALLQRLSQRGVTFLQRANWTGFSEDGSALFETPDTKEQKLEADAVLLALGGASWPRLGSSGSWTTLLGDKGIAISPLHPANCGFRIGWSDLMTERFAGTPLKRLRMTVGRHSALGEAVISSAGLEGGLVYALSADLRTGIETEGQSVLSLDLRPDLSIEQLTRKLSAPRRKQSISTFLRKAANLSPAEAALLREAGPLPDTPEELAQRIKDLQLTTQATYDIDRAISSAGGIRLDQLDDGLMLKALPGVFAAGEMLDWEAPTGGYLLQACFATGLAAAKGIDAYLTGKKG
ncbi:TIGR03862 family flavoprotein [Roseibium litorale]|uniref:TIGR03862 family flavoprotein n=1 Tax=Roseibium litorale TaxID=2803841 RepID=A0ABR9CNN5_9HYPH|nr:TIGR03862 family flavoprotein [Roseibium litorale]MBD8892229.1 TIGR03862 family flavoprotein [Roseibium litorale]